GANGFRYSIVDMNLASGNGSVTVKNSLLISTVSEKITAVKDPNSNRFWVLAHEWNSSNFYAYSLTSTGLSAPVITNIGTVHSGTAQNTYGQMKFNPCGNKVALTIGYSDVWEYFDFNTNTGVLSNAMSFPMTAHVYGMEFSPDASKVYVSTYDPFKTLVQYDVSSNNASLISVTEVSLSVTTDIYGLQLANDGKVYVCKSFSQYLGVVNSPNIAGAACNYQDLQINLDPSLMGITSALGLPGFPQNYFMPNSFTCPVVLGVNEIKVLDKPIVIYPNPSANDFNLIIEEPTTLKVYNYTGELIEFITIAKPRTISIGENYAAGIYFVKTESQGKTNTTKIIKK
ncbi:MAG TPA: T9SS type A sorting domain-containing protein, partial [Bacteroidia bacterium]|nr:T9SS type A sorting domain-containing protein [Bacteroidia bacterium]